MVAALGRIAARYSPRPLKNLISNDSYKSALFIEYLNTITVIISQHDMAGAALNRELGNTIELAKIVSLSTELGKILAFHIKYLDSTIIEIADNNSVFFGINIDATRKFELCVALALRTEDTLWLVRKENKYCIFIIWLEATTASKADVERQLQQLQAKLDKETANKLQLVEKSQVFYLFLFLLGFGCIFCNCLLLYICVFFVVNRLDSFGFSNIERQ